MIITYKVRHDRDFTEELAKARKVAEFAIANRDKLSTKYVKHIGLKAAIACQVLRKYGLNKKAKSVKNVKLIISGYFVKVDKEKKEIYIPCLKLTLHYWFPNNFNKVNQVELDNKFVYVAVTIPEKPLIEPKTWIGVDRNTTGHIAVVGIPTTGKVIKLGKKARHIHRKYKNIRRTLQKKRKFSLLKKIKNRESRIIRDLDHKVSRAIVNIAKQLNAGIKLENLKEIRRNKKHRKEFNCDLHSWSFYQLQKFIEYKACLEGIPVAYVEPQNTSKECSRCGSIGTREGKSFKCPTCGHVDHADANASFNIALRLPSMVSIGQLHIDRDMCKGTTAAPKWQCLRTTDNHESLEECRLSHTKIGGKEFLRESEPTS
jgi:putative transposase